MWNDYSRGFILPMDISSKKLVSYIIPWCDRSELAITLDGNRKLFSAESSQVIIVNAGGNFAWLKTIVTKHRMPNVELVNIDVPSFNKCTCFNVGASYAVADKIFLLDCDVTVPAEVIDESVAALNNGNFITIQDGIESDPEGHYQVLKVPFYIERKVVSRFLFDNGNSASVEFQQSNHGRSLCGLMLLYKDHYIEVGGCDSRIKGWGFEDYDLQIRLQAQLGLQRVSLGRATHITHATAPADDLTLNNKRNTEQCFKRYSSGNFLGTYAEDVEYTKSRCTRIAAEKFEEISSLSNK